MSEIKLKPCPSCGGEAVKSAFSWGNICDEYTIKCTECGISTKVLKSDEAVKAWNTRKPIDNIVEKLEDRSKKCIPLADEFVGGKFTGLRQAIEIVKRGGVNE